MEKQKRRRVYIPNKGAGHDYSSAAIHGDLVFVTSGHINIYNTGRIYRQWVSALETSTETDYIVVTSLNVLCMIGAGLFAAKHGRLNLLIFTSEGKYKKREIIFDSDD